MVVLIVVKRIFVVVMFLVWFVNLCCFGEIKLVMCFKVVLKVFVVNILEMVKMMKYYFVVESWKNYFIKIFKSIMRVCILVLFWVVKRFFKFWKVYLKFKIFVFIFIMFLFFFLRRNGVYCFSCLVSMNIFFCFCIFLLGWKIFVYNM